MTSLADPAPVGAGEPTDGGGGVADAIRRLGGRATAGIMGLGRLTRFAGNIALVLARPPYRTRRLISEIHESGVRSLAIICSSGLAVGMVLGLQGYNTLVRFGAEESLGAVVGLSLIRELGPVLTGLLVTGRAGSAMAAEIGMMSATEQLDGMRTMGVDPLHFVVGPKALAMILSMPLLSGLFTVFGIAGGFLVGVWFLGLDGGVYLSGLESAVDFESDVLGSLLKSAIFGLLVAIIATYRGTMAERNAAAVSAATTRTVVTASVSIVVADYIVTALWGV